MASGLAALLDDIAALARAAAANLDDVSAAAGRASAKAAGVVVDDAAVTPRFVTGITPKRELPIIWKIFLGSLRNKLLLIIPLALILSQFAPWSLTPILMLGGTYLCFEGAEKVLEYIFPGHAPDAAANVARGPESEKKIVSGAIRTDLILSAEIMMISLAEVAAETFWSRLTILIVVAFIITIGVYGVVALFVKMDDIGMALAERKLGFTRVVGRGLAAAMPKVLTGVSVIGVFAMLWVGGHILLVGTDELGWHWPYSLVHYLEGLVAGFASVGPALAWCINTLCSLLLGLLWGSVVVGIVHLIPKRSGGPASSKTSPPERKIDGEIEVS